MGQPQANCSSGFLFRNTMKRQNHCYLNPMKNPVNFSKSIHSWKEKNSKLIDEEGKMRNYLNKIKKINPMKILLLLLICISLTLSIPTIQADTIPEKIPTNNILDANHRVNQKTINQTIQ